MQCLVETMKDAHGHCFYQRQSEREGLVSKGFVQVGVGGGGWRWVNASFYKETPRLKKEENTYHTGIRHN